jgi:hypothetical protein
MKCALVCLTLALLAFAVCGSLGSDTAINFNFEGMIPPASGSCSDCPRHHQLRVFEVSTTDVATPGFGSDESAPLMTGIVPPPPPPHYTTIHKNVYVLINFILNYWY